MSRRRLMIWGVVAALLAPVPAVAFPGVMLSKDGSRHVTHTAHVVVVQNGPLSVVTVMADHEGPLSPFALALPVPSDVTLDRVRAVKREFVARLEQISAPRFHAFYEQDPCDAEPTQQDWDVRYEATDPGCLAPEFLPPPERNW